MRKSLLFFVILCLAKLTSAQIYEFGGFGGGAYYMGDINPEKHFYSINFSMGALYRYQLHSRLSFRFDFINAKLSGDDTDFDNPYQNIRNESFTTNLYELTGNVEFDYFPSSYEGNSNYSLTPYTIAGLGFFYVPDISDYSLFIPVGTGFKFYVNKHWTINLEWNFRFGFDDQLDKLKNDYPDNTAEFNNTLQQTFEKNNDIYSLFGMYITYRLFTNNSVCPAYGRINN